MNENVNHEEKDLFEISKVLIKSLTDLTCEEAKRVLNLAIENIDRACLVQEVLAKELVLKPKYIDNGSSRAQAQVSEYLPTKKQAQRMVDVLEEHGYEIEADAREYALANVESDERILQTVKAMKVSGVWQKMLILWDEAGKRISNTFQNAPPSDLETK